MNSLLPRGATLDRLDRFEVGLYMLAVWLEERGKRKLLAKMFRILIGGEAGTVGGDLEEYPAGLPEVDRTEVVAVYDRCHIEPGLYQPPAPRYVLFLVGGSERDVVYPSRAGHAMARKVRPLHEPHLGAATAGPDLEDDRPVPAFRILSSLPEAHNLREHIGGRLQAPQRQGDAFGAPDSPVDVHGALLPGDAWRDTLPLAICC